MKIGYTKRLINPNLPCHMEGYQDRIGIAQHDDLYVNTLYINNGIPIIIHVLDILLIEKEWSDSIKDRLNKEYGIDEDNIFIEAIHTHSGPKVSHKLDPEIPLDSNYFERMEEAISMNTKYVLFSAVEGKAAIGSIDVDGFYTNRNGVHLPNYRKADVLRFKSLDDKPIVDYVNLACHPTILNGSNLEVSTDYVGVMRETYKELTSIDLMFSNCECGDVSTRCVRQGADFKEVDRIGKGIANTLAKIDNFVELTLSNPKVLKKTLEITYNPKEDEFILDMKKKLPNASNYYHENDQRVFMKDMFLANLNNKYSHDSISLDATAYVVEFDDFRIVTIPGELVFNLGHKLRSVDKKPMFILTYTNDFRGYHVDLAQYGIYFETFMSEYPEGYADKLICQIISMYK